MVADDPDRGPLGPVGQARWGNPDTLRGYLADLETAAAFVAAFGLELAGG